MDAKIKVKIYIFESLFKMDAECIKPFHQEGGGGGLAKINTSKKMVHMDGKGKGRGVELKGKGEGVKRDADSIR